MLSYLLSFPYLFFTAYILLGCSAKTKLSSVELGERVHESFHDAAVSPNEATAKHCAAKQLYLEFAARGLGDPDGAFNTFFSDNSVATESAEFAPDGASFATVSKSKNSVAKLRVWSSTTYQMLWSASVGGETEAVSYSLDGKVIVTGGESHSGAGSLMFWDAQSAQLIVLSKPFHYPASIEGLRFSPDGRYLATGDESGHIVIWNSSDSNAANWEVRQDIDASGGSSGPQDINQIDWTADSRSFVAAQRNGVVSRYSVKHTDDKQIQFFLSKTYPGFEGTTVKSVRLSPDGNLVAAGAGNAAGVRIWDFDNGELIRYLPSEKTPIATQQTGKPLAAERIETVLFSPDSKVLFTGGSWRPGWIIERGFDSLGHSVELSLFDVNELIDRSNKTIMPYLRLPAWRQEYFDISPDGKLFLSSHDDGSWRLWHLRKNC